MAHLILSFVQVPVHNSFINVLYLQSNRKVPDSLTAQITFQDGSTHDYTVPVIKVQAYTLEENRDKHLCILIPFLPLGFRPMLKSGKRPEKEELTDFLQQIIIILEGVVAMTEPILELEFEKAS